MINAVVFDLGGVLIDWDPRYLYRKLFKTEQQVSFFLENICTPDWNAQQDKGRKVEDANRILIKKYPFQKDLITAYYSRWNEMLGGPIHGSVKILEKLRHTRIKIYALTNFSSETYPIAEKEFPFLQLFDGVLVSGAVKLAKPDSRIFSLLTQKFLLVPRETVFIDNQKENVTAALTFGYKAILFESPKILEKKLKVAEIL